MNKKITDLHSFQVAGGKARWSKIPKKQRSTMMKAVRKGGKPKIPFDCNCDTDRPLTKFERELSQGLNEFLAKKLKPKLKIDKKRVKVSKIVEDMERSIYERAVGKKG